MTPAADQHDRPPSGINTVLTVARSPRLRRIQLAFLAFNLMEWATWIAITVYAYGRGGAAEAGLAACLQLVPSAVVAPIGSLLGDRYPRARVLRLAYAIQGIAAVAAALALAAAAPSLLVYLLGTITASAITLTRPVQGALLPELSDSAAELTAANVTSATIENAGVLLGPAAAAILLTVAGPASVFGLFGALMVLAALSLPEPSPEERDPRFGGFENALRREILGGVDALRRHPPTRAVVAVLTAGYLVMGALDVFYVVLAIDVLRLDDGAAGVLNGAVGAGGLVGAAAAVALVGRRRISAWLVAGGIAFGVGIALSGLVGAPLGAAGGLLLVLAGLVLAGAGRAIADVAAWTLLQRATPSHVLSRVLGVLEATNALGQGVGALLAAVMVTLLGTSGAMLALALVLPVAGLLRLGRLRGFETRFAASEQVVARLRSVAIFAPLTPPVLERLASHAQLIVVPGGDLVIREGDVGDRFYVVDEGAVEATVRGRPMRVLGPGGGFGEIALLRDTPRTATVTALEPTQLLAIDRDTFLEALAGRRPSRAVAERIVDERLGAS